MVFGAAGRTRPSSGGRRPVGRGRVGPCTATARRRDDDTWGVRPGLGTRPGLRLSRQPSWARGGCRLVTNRAVGRRPRRLRRWRRPVRGGSKPLCRKRQPMAADPWRGPSATPLAGRLGRRPPADMTPPRHLSQGRVVLGESLAPLAVAAAGRIRHVRPSVAPVTPRAPQPRRGAHLARSKRWQARLDRRAAPKSPLVAAPSRRRPPAGMTPPWRWCPPSAGSTSFSEKV